MSQTYRVESAAVTDGRFPGNRVVLEEELPVSPTSKYPYGIGRGWTLSVYSADVLLYEASYFGDADGRERALADASFFVQLKTPPGFAGELTFDDLRFDKESV